MRAVMVFVLVCLAGVARADDEPTLRAAAVASHAAAQKTNLDADFQRAVDAYATYLAAFPHAPQASELRFYRAQILIHHLHRAVEGADEIMLVAKATPAAKFVEDGLLDAIDVYFAAADDNKLAAAADRYAELAAGGPHLVGVIFKLARRAHDRKDYADAVSRLRTIVTTYPNDPAAAAAADLLLDSLAQLRDTEALETTARTLKSLPGYKGAAHQTRLDQIIVDTMRVRADDLARKRDWKHGAEAYLRIATEFPKSEHVDETYYNAGVLLDQAGDFDAAVAALRKVYELRPASRLAARALLRAGAIDEVLRPERAAEELIRASAIGCGPDLDCREGADARYNAAVMFAAIGDNPKAMAAFATYLKDFPKGPDLAKATLQLGAIAKRAGDFTRAEKTFEKYTSDHRRDAAAWLELGKVSAKLDHRDASERALQIARAIAAQDKTTKLVAEALFEIAELHRRDIDKMKPTAEREVAMLNVQAYYTQITELGESYWTVAALDRAAHVDDAYVTAMGTSTLAKVATLRDRAIAHYREALAKADELGVVGEYVLDARARLARLVPAEHDLELGREAREGFRDHSFWPEPIDHR